MSNCMAIMASFFFPQDVGMDLTDFQCATLTAIIFLGTFVGITIDNAASNSFGRRSSFLACTFITAIFGFLGCIMPNFAGIMVMRFMVGLGLGGTNQPFYSIVELVPHQRRGQTLLKLGFAWSAGSVLTPAIGLFTIDKEGLGWRIFLFLCSAPSLVSLIAAYFLLPESPRWLLSKGSGDEAVQVLRDAAMINNQDPWAVCAQSVTLVRGGKTKSTWTAITRVFRKEWRRMILFMIPVFLVVDFLYYSFVQLIHMALSNTDGPEDEFAFVAITLCALSEFIGIIIAMLCIDRVGRAHTQTAAYLLGGIFIIGVCVGRHFEDDTTDDRTATSFLFYLCFLARLCIMTATNVTW